MKFMVKEVEYNATDGKLGLTLNHGGIKFLYLLLHPKLQKDLTLRRVSLAQGHPVLRQAQHGSKYGERSRTKRSRRMK